MAVDVWWSAERQVLIVLNLCCGSYDNTEGISAKLRAHGIGVLDADSDPIYGGGADAHLLANATFSFFLALEKKLG